jgi:hypothetical protein
LVVYVTLLHVDNISRRRISATQNNDAKRRRSTAQVNDASRRHFPFISILRETLQTRKRRDTWHRQFSECYRGNRKIDRTIPNWQICQEVSFTLSHLSPPIPILSPKEQNHRSATSTFVQKEKQPTQARVRVGIETSPVRNILQIRHNAHLHLKEMMSELSMCCVAHGPYIQLLHPPSLFSMAIIPQPQNQPTH